MKSRIKEIIILGTGGSSRDILDIINDINKLKRDIAYKCLGFLDDDESKIGEKIGGLKVLGNLNSAKNYKNFVFINGIGSPANFFLKEKIIKKTTIPLDRFETIIHPTASVSKSAKIGKGTVISQNATICSNVQIGNHTIILPNVVISHDDIIGDYTCVASAACISGGVNIGKLCYIGANSTLKENIKVDDFCLIGIGSVVLEDVPETSVVVGNPAKFLRQTK